MRLSGQWRLSTACALSCAVAGCLPLPQLHDAQLRDACVALVYSLRCFLCNSFSTKPRATTWCYSLLKMSKRALDGFLQATADADRFFADRKQRRARAENSPELPPSPGSRSCTSTEPPSPDTERATAIDRIRAQLLEPDLPQQGDDADDIRFEVEMPPALETYWRDGATSDAMDPLEWMAEIKTYQDANSVEGQEEETPKGDAEEEEPGELGAEEPEMPEDIDAEEEDPRNDTEEDAPEEMAAEEQEKSEDLNVEKTLDEVGELLANEARSIAASSFQPRRNHWSMYKGRTKDLTEGERLAMAVERATRAEFFPHHSPMPEEGSRPGFMRGQKWRASAKRWANAGGRQKRAGRDFAKEAREGKLANTLSKLAKARMAEHRKRLDGMSPAERHAYIAESTPTPPPPPAAASASASSAASASKIPKQPLHPPLPPPPPPPRR